MTLDIWAFPQWLKKTRSISEINKENVAKMIEVYDTTLVVDIDYMLTYVSSDILDNMPQHKQDINQMRKDTKKFYLATAMQDWEEVKAEA